jgi:hypothetical protein
MGFPGAWWSKEDHERIAEMPPGERWLIIGLGLLVGVPVSVFVIWLIAFRT